MVGNCFRLKKLQIKKRNGGGGLKEINGVTIVVLSVYVKSSDKEH